MNNINSVVKFLSRYGLSEDDVKKAFDSYQVKLKIDSARELANKAGVRGTPYLLINRKYLIGPKHVNSHQGYIDRANQIIKQIKEGKL